MIVLATANMIPHKLSLPDMATSVCEINTHAPAIPNMTPVIFCILIASLRNSAERNMGTMGLGATISEK